MSFPASLGELLPVLSKPAPSPTIATVATATAESAITIVTDWTINNQERRSLKNAINHWQLTGEGGKICRVGRFDGIRTRVPAPFIAPCMAARYAQCLAGRAGAAGLARMIGNWKEVGRGRPIHALAGAAVQRPVSAPAPPRPGNVTSVAAGTCRYVVVPGEP